MSPWAPIRTARVRVVETEENAFVNVSDPTATVAYHSADQELFDQVLGSRGVRRAGFANRPVVVANDLDDIIRTIALYSSEAVGSTQ